MITPDNEIVINPESVGMIELKNDVKVKLMLIDAINNAYDVLQEKVDIINNDYAILQSRFKCNNYLLCE